MMVAADRIIQRNRPKQICVGVRYTNPIYCISGEDYEMLIVNLEDYKAIIQTPPFRQNDKPHYVHLS